jgi:hypothetical protein
MKDMSTMMLALQHFCARHGVDMPTAVEVRFAKKDDAHRFATGLKADYDRDTTTIKGDYSGVDKVCDIPLRVAYADRDGEPVRI